MIEKLKQKVGTPYEMFFEDGTYKGCFMPVYELYPELPRFKLPSEKPEDNYNYGMDLVEKYTIPIFYQDLKPGDVIATYMNDVLHIAVYIGDNKIIHVCRSLNLRISRLTLFKNYSCHRIIK